MTDAFGVGGAEPGVELGDVWGRVVTTLEAARLGLDGGERSAGRRASGDARQPVSVTVLTGFLGAGKTTLLRRLLLSEHGLRIAAIVNDVSSMAFDASAVAASADEVVSLANGCSCCSLAGELGDALSRVASGRASVGDASVGVSGRASVGDASVGDASVGVSGRASVGDASVGDASVGEPPDVIVLEPSGVSDAVEVAQVVEALPDVRLDGVVTVVDASEATRQLGDPRLAPTMLRQLDAAHLVVLSKVDLVTDASAAALIGELAGLAPGRPVLPSRNGDADVSALLGAAVRGARPRPPSGGHSLGVWDAVIDDPAAATRTELAAILDALPEGVLRIKGWCEVSEGVGGEKRLVEVQVVGRRWTVTDAVAVRPDEPLGLTVIAVDETALAAASQVLSGVSATLQGHS